jgi:hypothetical protein
VTRVGRRGQPPRCPPCREFAPAWSRERGRGRRTPAGAARPRREEVMWMLALLAQAEGATDTILWIIAAVLVIAGIISLVRGGVIAGIVLIVLGLLVGPGGVSLFD